MAMMLLQLQLLVVYCCVYAGLTFSAQPTPPSIPAPPEKREEIKEKE